MKQRRQIPETLLDELQFCIDVERGLRRCAFDMARVLKVYYGDPTQALRATVSLSEELELPDSWDMEFLLEAIYAAWDKILYAATENPLENAATWARTQEPPELRGEWPPLKRTRNDAALTLLICTRMSQGGTKAFYLSCRTLARTIGGDHNRAASILRLLVTNGHLILDKKATKHQAQFYRVNPDIDHIEDIDHIDHVETKIHRDKEDIDHIETKETQGRFFDRQRVSSNADTNICHFRKEGQA